MGKAEDYDWDKGLAKLIAEETAYSQASQLFAEWAESPYGDFTKIDASGTVAVAMAAYISGYPNVAAFVEDMDVEVLAWLVELVESLIIQGIFIGMGYVTSEESGDLIYMSPEIVKFLAGESYESRFDPPKGYNPNEPPQDG
jgi:hypothetical protein